MCCRSYIQCTLCANKHGVVVLQRTLVGIQTVLQAQVLLTVVHVRSDLPPQANRILAATAEDTTTTKTDNCRALTRSIRAFYDLASPVRNANIFTAPINNSLNTPVYPLLMRYCAPALSTIIMVPLKYEMHQNASA